MNPIRFNKAHFEGYTLVSSDPFKQQLCVSPIFPDQVQTSFARLCIW